MNQPLSGMNAIVTGGGSGIGLACAMAFRKDGANILVMGRTESKLETATQKLLGWPGKGKVQYFVGDAGEEESVQQAVALAANSGRLDIAIANAGTGSLAPIEEIKDSEWQRVMQTNLSGPFYLVKSAAASMSGGGAICAISSIAGVRTHRFMSAYCTSKAAVDMLVRNSADELGKKGIRVNSVCPGLVETELASGLLATEAVYEDYRNCMPLNRHGQAVDIAAAVRFLCGPESTWITGVNLSVDGGHHLRRGPDLNPIVEVIYGE
ncbi:MAG: glucose 1-dehydrogenase [Gammaproteobacteria bacterium]|jgi:NAD(P)-dependent dehydrogenase (short-subunit alcohol dehydrogenase family)|nr:glucose 1-dehydrogenase [Gammaproteobacteria bacterium]MBT5203501.1 glucose 1-dehydrogenase [Gammaproteobacteria bacterium]MBT5600979.1 glucose 1-dehydrogenase [Gammaproteobacteria bacterium]MBT6245288.1 glucose 1-dehydrogenase [Gammaproteobacteria bacterium]